MNTRDTVAFARMLEALSPWSDRLVIIGGWAHRLHRFYPNVVEPRYEPLVTRDADVAFDPTLGIEGDIGIALKQAGFVETLSGDHTPPISQYQLGQDGGFYVEFLSPLRGSASKRDGLADATVRSAGVTAQKLRHLDLLLVEPWRLNAPIDGLSPPGEEPTVQVANPVSFMVQKLLIHNQRRDSKKAQDILYLNDTIELFDAQLPRLRKQWLDAIRPTLSNKDATRARQAVAHIFSKVGDSTRSAAQMVRDRGITPDEIQLRCESALGELLTE